MNFFQKFFFFLFLFLASSFFPKDCLAWVDLRAESITFSPSQPVLNQECTIKARILVLTDEEITEEKGFNSFNFSAENFELDEKIYIDPPYSDGHLVDYNFIGKFTKSGDQDIRFNVNDKNILTESKYTNNSIWRTIEVISNQDIEVAALTLNPTNPVVNQEVDVIVEVINTGNDELSYNTGFRHFEYDFEDFILKSSDIPTVSSLHPVESGGSVYYVFKGFFDSSGEKNVHFKIDIEDDLDESNDENNILVDKFTITDAILPDIELSEIVFSTSSEKLMLSERFSVQIIAKNVGDKSLVSDLGFLGDDFVYNMEGFYINEVSMDEVPSFESPLNPGDSFIYNIEGYFQYSGQQVFSFVFDKQNNLREVNEDNNATSTTIFVYKNEEDMKDFQFITDKANPISSTSVDIIWETNKETIGTVYIMGNDFSVSNVSSEKKKNHKINIGNLNDGSTYEYKIEASTDEVKHDTGWKKFILPAYVQEKVVDDDIADNQNIQNNSTIINQNPDNNQKNILETDKQIQNMAMYNRLKGKIVLKVEDAGKAYYINPVAETRHYLGRPDDAFAVMRSQGIGVSNANLSKIPVAVIDKVSGTDTDGDGLSDMMEDAIGTDKNKVDTDGDGYHDKDELKGGYNPLGSGIMNSDTSFANKQFGKIFIQVEGNGEAWYVNPVDGKRYFLGRPADAFSVMRDLGLGISNGDFDSL